MPTNRLLFACLLTLLSAPLLAAPMPRLDKAAPTLCPASAKAKDEWMPTAAQVAALEKALPAYFATRKARPDQLPNGKYVYARQYSGFTRKGKRLIWGSFYPNNDPMFADMKPGSCWIVSDGGNAFWSISFDPQTGKIVDLLVNGHA